MSRKIRIGIDVGGTHTKAVALDNETHEIVGLSQVKTTHDHPDGVAAGVIEAFQNCIKESGIDPNDIIFVAHSTTQATNALLEGDVANVGVFGMSKGGLEGMLAKKQTCVGDIDLGTGRSIHVQHSHMTLKHFNEDSANAVLNGLLEKGAQVVVASMAFGVDGDSYESRVRDLAEAKGVPVTVASEITKLYGLTRRTRTAVINASILPKMLNTAISTESSVRSAGIQVPLMIMRGDGGVMDIAEMKKRPVLTMLSGPAASVMGALMYLRASNGIYFEVGGTSTNIGVIKDGRPAVDYTTVGGHRTYINSLDVIVLGVAGGSMVRATPKGVVDVGPRSAHIAGLEYAVYTPVEEMVEPVLEFITPKPGDPSDYVAVRLKSGKRVAITNSCAANVLGLVTKEHFSYGNVESARIAIQCLADYTGQTVEETATAILQKAADKIKPVIDHLAAKYKLEREQISLVGCGGGAAALLPFFAQKEGLDYSIPQYAEVISSIGVALAMVRDVVERIIPNPTSDDIRKIKREAKELAINSGAVPDSIEVHIEIDSQTSKITAIALGSTEVRSADLLKECSLEEARAIAAKDMAVTPEETTLELDQGHFYIFRGPEEKNKHPIRLVDKKGFIKVQRRDGVCIQCKVNEAEAVLRNVWDQCIQFRGDGLLRPDIYICMEGKLADYTNILSADQMVTLAKTDICEFEPEEEIVIVGAKNFL